MPIIIPRDIPAFETLKNENIFVMTKKRAIAQDIRPIEIAIVNLMPTKETTETQLIRLLSNSPLQVNITLVNTATYRSKNVSPEHLKRFYKNFAEIRDKKFDGMIITGAPVETLDFEEVEYWKELTEIMDFAAQKVTSTIFICWGAQAGLYYHYGIQKVLLDKKLFGVFPHEKCVEYEPLLKGFDDVFYVPHSRHTTVPIEKIAECRELEILAKSDRAGASIVKSRDNRRIFLTGHMEYDKFTLKAEYDRDIAKGMDIAPPENYFTDETHSDVSVTWHSTANLLFSNWLNYYVYQVTPYDIEQVKG